MLMLFDAPNTPRISILSRGLTSTILKFNYESSIINNAVICKVTKYQIYLNDGIIGSQKN